MPATDDLRTAGFAFLAALNEAQVDPALLVAAAPPEVAGRFAQLLLALGAALEQEIAAGNTDLAARFPILIAEEPLP